MKISNTLTRLVALIVVLALIAAGIGLLYQDGGSPSAVTTIRGQTVQLYGQGLYSYDTPIPALSFKMGDLTTLLVGIPLLILSTILYRRGSIKGGLALCGALGYFLYGYISMSFGAAYNNLFIVYLALLAASFYAFILALSSFDLAPLPGRFSAALPRRGIGTFFVVTGVLLALIWLGMIIIPALLAGQAPDVVETYTTFMTGVLDVGLVAPGLIVIGLLLLRDRPLGYLLAPAALVFTAVLGTSITLAGIAQLQAGVVSIGQFIGMTFSFTVLTLFALWFGVALFRSVAEPRVAKAAALRGAHA